jgi:two-component system phosphate regulon sensor histidine kinase PhoR
MRDQSRASAKLSLDGPPPRTVFARAASQRTTEGCVLVLHDITELQQLERVRQTFVANVSHELRTPLSVIRANTEALLDGALDDPDAAREFLSATGRHADRLTRLVTDLLDLSRIEAGQLGLQPRAFSVLPLVEQVLSSMAAVAAERQISLEARVPQLVDVIADVSALEQVLLNLVDNAIKYGRAGGSVWVTAVQLDGTAQIQVKDDGPGIDPAHHERLFERFYRVDVGRSRDVGGTGLGLAIVKHLVTGMGGTISVRSREPEGTVFSVQLPA